MPMPPTPPSRNVRSALSLPPPRSRASLPAKRDANGPPPLPPPVDSVALDSDTASSLNPTLTPTPLRLPLATSSLLGVVLLELIAGLGFGAMALNLSNQSRNVLSKKVMVNKEESLDNITLFSIITVMSFVLLFPVTFFTEGLKFTPASLQAATQQGLNVQQVLTRSFLAALCFHAYQQRVSPATHSVGNCVKRVVVIVSSVLFFRTLVSPINSLRTGVALAGVFLYSRVKRIKPKPKTT
ncbi:hypothetical protein ACJRO7_026591 [Eucalyptus globulus]|uniref:Sugar phosphate transporter domain-containing protein n=1 Tax=Eucalyptus globulus TaxID=34317 RepID=A0ABD3JSC5_EUCGL